MKSAYLVMKHDREKECSCWDVIGVCDYWIDAKGLVERRLKTAGLGDVFRVYSWKVGAEDYGEFLQEFVVDVTYVG